MSYNWTNLKLAAAMVSAAEVAVQRSLASLDRNRIILVEEHKKLVEFVSPFFLEAIEEFCERRTLVIDVRSMCYTVSVEQRKISLDVIMRDDEGNEPIGKFGSDEIRELNESFATYINLKLKTEEIPFSFGTFAFPSDYYSR